MLQDFLKFLFVDIFPFKFIYVISACLFWIGYVFYRRSKSPEVFEEWGFTKENLRESFRLTGLMALIVFILMLIYRGFNGGVYFSQNMIPILLLYPVWGVIQQFLMMSLIGGNMKALNQPPWLVVAITSIMFSIVHYPSLVLMAGTFFLAIIYTRIFLKYPNLWALGLFHGWLGCFFFYWILDRDPWLEFIAMLN